MALRSDAWNVAGRALLARSQALAYLWRFRQQRRSSAPPTVGTAALSMRVAREDHVENVLGIARLARANGARALVIGTVYRDHVAHPPEGDDIEAHSASLRAAAEQEGIPYLEIPELTESVHPGNADLFGEHIHPKPSWSSPDGRARAAGDRGHGSVARCADTGGRAVKRALPLALLFLAGAVHWAVFLSPTDRPFAGPAFTVEDWPKEYRYYEVLQQAVRQGRVPLYISRPIHTRKFLALPETLWAPQVLLLGVIPIGPFVVVNTLLLYAAGCFGLLALRRRYGLSLPAFAFLFVAFMLNGHVAAHLAVGHSMWAGYFLLPLFALPVLDLVEDRGTGATPLWIALVLFALVLQGALHIFVWCAMLLGLLAVFSLRRAPAVLCALAWAGGLTACRLVPAFFLMNRKDQAFLSGVPSLAAFWHGLVTVRDPRQALEGGRFGTLAWWELDFYLGAVGLAWLIVFGLVLRFRARDRAAWRRPGLDGALLVLALLAVGDLYAAVNASPIPLLNAERVSSRFLVLPLAFLMILAAARLEHWLREAHPVLSRVALVSVALFAASLGTHSAVWRVARLEAVLPHRPGNLEMTIAPSEDVPGSAMERAYRAAVHVSALVSLLTLGALGVRLRRIRSRPSEAATVPTAQSPSDPPSTEE